MNHWNSKCGNVYVLRKTMISTKKMWVIFSLAALSLSISQRLLCVQLIHEYVYKVSKWWLLPRNEHCSKHPYADSKCGDWIDDTRLYILLLLLMLFFSFVQKNCNKWKIVKSWAIWKEYGFNKNETLSALCKIPLQSGLSQFCDLLFCCLFISFNSMWLRLLMLFYDGSWFMFLQCDCCHLTPIAATTSTTAT